MGEAACAAVIFKGKKRVAHLAKGLGKRTNNEAEYEALILGLVMSAMAGPELVDPIIYSDSAVVVNQVNGKWNCNKQESLYPYLMTVMDIKSEFRFKLVQVTRAYVAQADALCNEFLDSLETERGLVVSRKKLSIP